MQQIAMENNIAETAFCVPEKDGYRIRWFTPAVEVDLCGHATLASAHVLFNHLGYANPTIKLESLSGLLTVRKQDGMITLDFPKDELNKSEAPGMIKDAIGETPAETYSGKNVLLLVLSSQKAVEELMPDYLLISKIHPHGIIVTAKGDSSDFVSRCFFPNCGINEDPVTGSAHTILTPYWSMKLNKNKMTAMQLSKRKGFLICELKGNRVEISGNAVSFLEGEINIMQGELARE